MNYGEQAQSQAVTLADERRKVRRYFANTQALEAVMAEIAEGARIAEIAKRLNVPYSALYNVLTSTYKEQHRAARAAFAELLAQKNLDMADKVEALELPHDAAKTAAGLRHWHMERTAGEQWGQRSSVDVTHKGVVGLHLEAIRQLADEPLEGEYEEVQEIEGPDDSGPGGDSGDDDGGSTDNLDDHPLL